MNNIGYFFLSQGAKEMGQWVKFLPQKHEDMIRIPRGHIRNVAAGAHTAIPVLLWRWEEKTGGSLQAPGPACLHTVLESIQDAMLSPDFHTPTAVCMHGTTTMQTDLLAGMNPKHYF